MVSRVFPGRSVTSSTCESVLGSNHGYGDFDSDKEDENNKWSENPDRIETAILANIDGVEFAAPEDDDGYPNPRAEVPTVEKDKGEFKMPMTPVLGSPNVDGITQRQTSGLKLNTHDN
ncbi:hypothetical protein AAE478_009555 [Parahypoxylon ruwenzoriense]